MTGTSQSKSATAEQTLRQAHAVGSASDMTSGNVQTVAGATEELSASIGEIWASPRYEELRAWQKAGAFAKIPYCAKCTEWQGMKWEYDYFTAMEKVLGKRLL